MHPLPALLFGRESRGPRERLAALLGLLGLVLLALGYTRGTGEVNAALVVLLVAALLQGPAAWQRLRGEPFAWLTLLVVVYLLLAAIRADQAPWAANADRGLGQWLAFSGLPTLVVAIALGGDRRRAGLMLGLALVSLVLAVLGGLTPGRLAAYLAGERATFGLGNNGPGVYLSLALIGLACLVPALGARWRERPVLGVAGWILLAALSLLLVLAIVFNQSRSSWLGLALVLPVVGAILLRRHAAALDRRHLWHAAAGLALLLAVPAYLGSGVVAERLAQEWGTIEKVLALDFAAVEVTSIGSRVHMWLAAGERIAEHPLLGWGPGSARALIGAVPGLPPLPHFHNLYLQAWVELGLVGLVLLAGLAVALVAAARRARRAGGLGPGAALFLAAAGVYFLVVSLAQVRHDDAHGLAVLAMLSGWALSARLYRPTGREAVHGA